MQPCRLSPPYKRQQRIRTYRQTSKNGSLDAKKRVIRKDRTCKISCSNQQNQTICSSWNWKMRNKQRENRPTICWMQETLLISLSLLLSNILSWIKEANNLLEWTNTLAGTNSHLTGVMAISTTWPISTAPIKAAWWHQVSPENEGSDFMRIQDANGWIYLRNWMNKMAVKIFPRFKWIKTRQCSSKIQCHRRRLVWCRRRCPWRIRWLIKISTKIKTYKKSNNFSTMQKEISPLCRQDLAARHCQTKTDADQKEIKRPIKPDPFKTASPIAASRARSPDSKTSSSPKSSKTIQLSTTMLFHRLYAWVCNRDRVPGRVRRAKAGLRALSQSVKVVQIGIFKTRLSIQRVSFRRIMRWNWRATLMMRMKICRRRSQKRSGVEKKGLLVGRYGKPLHWVISIVISIKVW